MEMTDDDPRPRGQLTDAPIAVQVQILATEH